MLHAGWVSSVELTRRTSTRIAKLNGPFESYADNGLYNAFVRIDEAGALAEARAADKRLVGAAAAARPAPWLCGIPMGFKDSIGTKGFKQQNGTTAFAGNVALRDSTPVAPAARPGRRHARHHDVLGLLRLDRRHVLRQRLEPRLRAGRLQPGLGRRADRAARRGRAGRGDGRLDHLPGRLQRRVGDQAVARPRLDRRRDAAVAELRRDRADRALRPRRRADHERDPRPGPDGDPQTLFAPVPFPRDPDGRPRSAPSRCAARRSASTRRTG